MFSSDLIVQFLILFLYSFRENKFVYSNKVFPFNMKSTNLIQKYPHIVQLHACIL